MNKLLTMAIALMAVLSAYAQSSKWDYHWTQDDVFRAADLSGLGSFNNSNYLILSFSDLPDAEGRSALGNAGIEILGYLEEGHYMARIKPSALNENNLRTHNVTALATPAASFVKTPLLEFYQTMQEIREYSVKIWSPDDSEAFQELIRNSGLTATSEDAENGVFRLLLGNEAIDELADNPAIAFIGPALDGRVPLLDNAINMARVNALRNPTTFGEGLSGEGIKVGIWDDGLTGNHVDINENVTNVEKDFYSYTQSKHPTHVSGVITGKGHKNVRVQGMAPGTDVFAWSFNGDIIQEMQQGVADYGLDIINSSFYLEEYNDPIVETMCFFPGYYVIESHEIDKMVRNNPTLIHTIANGNQNADCQGAGGWSGIPIGLQGAKNVISVGWLDANENFYGGSSVGPTYDGRLKPEVMSKGARLYGPDVNHGYQERWGSSGSAPTAAGAIALLQEWYLGNFGTMPDASLIRAVMCNTAQDDAFLPGPDYLFGFGRINGARALSTLQDTSFRMESVLDAQTNSFTIEVPAGVSQVNICLAWSDKEAIPGAAKTLVNNLDLRVVGPGATEYLPWTLNPLLPWLPPVTGVDSINNVEQVSIFTPAPGTYTIHVDGTEIPFGPQEYSVSYDIREQGITITHPIGGEQWAHDEYQYIRWDPNGTGAATTIDISYDDGSSWESIGVTNETTTFKTWFVADTTSHVCRMRVRSGAFESISGAFTIMEEVNPIYGNPCDEHLTVSWMPTADADDYIVMILENNEYVPVDTTTDTTYLFSNLENGKDYWVAVHARDGSKLALRSSGYMFSPDGSDCGFNNDIGVSFLCSPLGFRYGFDGSLPYTSPFQVVIRNYGANSVSGFDVCYQSDGGLPVCEAFPGTLGANAIDTFLFSTVESFPDTLNYDYSIWTTFGADVNKLNDTLEQTIKVLPSHPLPLPYYTGFENAEKAIYVSKAFGLNGMEEWDFSASSASGRISVGILEQLANMGEVAITLDEYSGIDTQSNEAILNLNLNGYQDSTIYLDFNYAGHGESLDLGDRVWGRADDTESWVELFDLTTNISNEYYTAVTAVNITEKLQFENSQTYGDHFQLKFGQEGSGRTIFMNTMSGRSFDEVRVYVAGEDLEVRNLQMQDIYCDSLNGTLPVTVTIRNNSPQDVANFTAGYTTNTGIDHTEIVPFLASYDSIQLTFSQEIAYTPGSVIELDIHIDHLDDLYPYNDSILDVVILVQPFAGAEYYEDFDGVNNVYRPSGIFSTWSLGVPSNTIISGAASGEKAWVTNLAGRYSNNEQSYLLTPCFDFTGYSSTPNFAFNLKLEIEKDYDYLSLEYSNDGIDWMPVWSTPESYNWFNGTGDFWDDNILEWETASGNVPLDSLSNDGEVLFRFALSADREYKEEGAGIDDIHVTEDIGPVYQMSDGGSAGDAGFMISNIPNNWIIGGEVAAGMTGNSTETVSLNIRKETATIFPSGNYALKRHLWTDADQSYTMRFYLPYSEYEAFYNDFAYWSAPSQMSVLAYGGSNVDSIDANNTNTYTVINEGLYIKPYRDGYILEFDWTGPGEFYIVTDSAMVVEESVDVAYMSATALNPDAALVDWGTDSEINIDGFIIKAGTDGMAYDSIGYIASLGSDSTMTGYTFTDSLYDKACLMYYQVCALTASGEVLEAGGDTASFVFAQLVMTDSLSTTIETNDDVTITWGTHNEKCNDRFDVLVSVNGVDYNLLGSVPSMGESTSWTAYELTDDSTPKQDSICYMLEQYYSDGSVSVYGPVCVYFEADESLVVGDMSATAVNPDDALVEWNTLSETGIEGFVIKVGTDGVIYDSIGYIIATGSDSTSAVYSMTDSIYEKACLMYYKVCAQTISGDTIFVGMDTASFVFPSLVVIDSLQAEVLPNEDVEITWGSHMEKCNDRFDVFVSINSGPAGLVGSVLSQGDSGMWTPYSFTDDSTPKIDTLCYTLTQFYQDGSSASFGPVCVIFESDTTAMVISSIDITPVSCAGGNDGAIDISIENGTPPYTIRWNEGSTTEDISDIPAGEYVVFVEDAAGESIQSGIIIVTEPPVLEISGGSITDISCNGTASGSVAGIMVTGGTPPYTYQWTNGSTDLDVAGLTAGTHQFTVTDSNGCELLSPIYLVQELPAISLTSIIIQDAACFGTSTGAIDIEVAGGTPPYSFAWSNGQMGEDLIGATAGIYACTITDAMGCVFSTDSLTVGEASQILITGISTSDVNCALGNDGEININVSGGTPPYSYLWSNGGNTQDINGLQEGDYFVTITDAAGCIAISPDIPIGEPFELQLSLVTITDLTCNGSSTGAIEIEINGGTPPFSFDWSNGATTQNIANISAGSYGAAITDMNGCTLNTGDIEVVEPDIISISMPEVVDATCHGGSDGAISLDVFGGTPPYMYSWNHGSNEEDVSGLTAGEYILDITDSLGCVFETDPVLVGESDPIIDGEETEVLDPDCYTSQNGGIIELVPEGGNPPYTYLWSTGDTTNSINNLDDGSYTCVVTDSEGCIGNVGPFVIQRPAPLELLMFEYINIACHGQSTGAIYAEVTGEIPPFEYQYDNGTEFFFTQNLIGISAGTYVLQVFDGNGCPLDTSLIAEITEPDVLLELSTSTTPESEPGSLDGTVSLDINGGDAPYTVHWSNGANTEDLAGLSAGEYCAEVMDANDCVTEICAEVGLGTYVEEIPGMDGLYLYPNPASNETVLRLVFETPTIVDIHLVDVKGRVLERLDGMAYTDDEIRFSVSDLAAGSYMIRIIAEGGVVSLPLIIQH